MLRKMGLGFLLVCLLFSTAALAKRSFKTCWTTCYRKSCSTLAKYYEGDKLWSKIEECQKQCKADCHLFEKTPAAEGRETASDKASS